MFFHAVLAQRELELLSEAGLTPDAVIAASTHNGALMLGREHELGTLEPGKRADMIILDADPLQDPGAAMKSPRWTVFDGVAHTPEEWMDLWNPVEPGAIMLRTGETQGRTDQYLIGHCPRYLLSDLGQLFEHSRIETRVRRVNPPPASPQRLGRRGRSGHRAKLGRSARAGASHRIEARLERLALDVRRSVLSSAIQFRPVFSILREGISSRSNGRGSKRM